MPHKAIVIIQFNLGYCIRLSNFAALIGKAFKKLFWQKQLL